MPRGQGRLFHQVAGLLHSPPLCRLLKGFLLRERYSLQVDRNWRNHGTFGFHNYFCPTPRDYSERIVTDWRIDTIGKMYIFR